MAKLMVALITPFKQDLQVDYVALKCLLARLMQEGVDGFIVCGTTAETPCLREDERYQILDFILHETQHEVEIWFGCGSNCTAATIKEVQHAQQYPIDGVLLAAPYYNRPSQTGIYKHFDEIAKQCQCDIMLYNIPSRTGVKIEAETIVKLINNHPNITALKQACDDFAAVRYIKQQFPTFFIYSGEDAAIDEALDAGMDGMISVMGHVALPKMKRFLKGKRLDNNLRKELQKEALLLFQEPSPACIKYVLAMKQEIENVLRLPMVTVQDEQLKKMLQETFIDMEK